MTSEKSIKVNKIKMTALKKARLIHLEKMNLKEAKMN